MPYNLCTKNFASFKLDLTAQRQHVQDSMSTTNHNLLTQIYVAGPNITTQRQRCMSVMDNAILSG